MATTHAGAVVQRIEASTKRIEGERINCFPIVIFAFIICDDVIANVNIVIVVNVVVLVIVLIVVIAVILVIVVIFSIVVFIIIVVIVVSTLDLAWVGD